VVAGRTTVVAITDRVTACGDAREDESVELAVNGRAGHPVNGDAGLLALHPVRGIAILTAAALVAACGA
jgi:predicted nucleic acid-binding protein